MIYYPFFAISFLVLSTGNGNNTETKEVDLGTCGVNFCPAVPEEPKDETLVEAPKEDNFSASTTQLYVLAGVYLACSILSAVTVALFVDPLSK